MAMPGADRARSDAHFNADAIAAAQERPTLQVGRLLYRGRLLSIEQWLPYWERLQELDRVHGDELADPVARLRDRSKFYREYLTAVFPKRDFRFWAPDPVRNLMRQSYQVVEQTVAFFFILQARATFGEQISLSVPATPGMPSPSKTPDASPTGAP